MKLEKALLACSTQMSRHAQFCLMTLLLLMGLTLGLWWAQPAQSAPGGGAATRGSAGSGLCQHASVAFAPELTVQALSRLLRAEDAHILYGPDEFGEYQLRFGSSSPLAQSLQSLQARSDVVSVTAHPQCE